MSEVLGKERMREIMGKALARFYPEGMAALFGTVEVPEDCCYFEPGIGGVLEHLSFLKADLYRHPGEAFVLELGFYKREPFSEGFWASYRVRFWLSDLEVA